MQFTSTIVLLSSMLSLSQAAALPQQHLSTHSGHTDGLPSTEQTLHHPAETPVEKREVPDANELATHVEKREAQGHPSTHSGHTETAVEATQVEKREVPDANELATHVEKREVQDAGEAEEPNTQVQKREALDAENLAQPVERRDNDWNNGASQMDNDD